MGRGKELLRRASRFQHNCRPVPRQKNGLLCGRLLTARARALLLQHPEPDGAAPVGANRALAVRRERDTRNDAAVAELVQLLSRGDVPESHRAIDLDGAVVFQDSVAVLFLEVTTTGHGPPAVRRECHAVDTALVTNKLLHLLAGG